MVENTLSRSDIENSSINVKRTVNLTPITIKYGKVWDIHKL